MYDTVRYIQPLKYLTYDTEKAFDFIEEVSDYTIGFFFFAVRVSSLPVALLLNSQVSDLPKVKLAAKKNTVASTSKPDPILTHLHSLRFVVRVNLVFGNSVGKGSRSHAHTHMNHTSRQRKSGVL